MRSGVSDAELEAQIQGAYQVKAKRWLYSGAKQVTKGGFPWKA